MREPIEPEDIREGDLIRAEWGTDGSAREYRATGDGRVRYYGYAYDVAFFLLDRPAPAVDLPTEPALRWVDWECLRVTGRDLGVYFDRGATLHAASPGDFHHEYVKGFTPAVAVPADALAALRRASNAITYSAVVAHETRSFFKAVDEANGSDS